MILITAAFECFLCIRYCGQHSSDISNLMLATPGKDCIFKRKVAHRQSLRNSYTMCQMPQVFISTIIPCYHPSIENARVQGKISTATRFYNEESEVCRGAMICSRSLGGRSCSSFRENALPSLLLTQMVKWPLEGRVI